MNSTPPFGTSAENPGALDLVRNPRFMQATAKTATRRVLGIRGGQGETLVPPTAVAGDDEGFVFEFEASDNNNSG